MKRQLPPIHQSQSELSPSTDSAVAERHRGTTLAEGTDIPVNYGKTLTLTTNPAIISASYHFSAE